MKQLSGLLEELKQKLCEDMPDDAGMRQISLPVPAKFTTPLLEWLAAQPVYPQFYWRHRDGAEEAAVCGQVRIFSSMQSANDFCRTLDSQNTMRIWGLNAFDQVIENRTLHADDTIHAQTDNSMATEAKQRQSWLFLPRFELVRRSQHTHLIVNLYSEHSLQKDAQSALVFLSQLRNAQPLALPDVQVTHVEHQPEKEAWCQLLNHALQAIHDQQMDKVVLARRTILTLNKPLSAARFMAASRAVNHRCYHFMLAWDAQNAFLGSSPERLYLRKKQQLVTEALAGTVENDSDDKRAQALGEWLMHDRKNRHENMLVVDDICQRLQNGARAVDVLPPEIIRLRKVQHLRRRIVGELCGADDAECLFRLQPTAAVAGLPREAARQYLLQHEPFSRDWYAGSAGYLAPAQAEFCVALRSAQVQDDQVWLYAGAGIVAGSQPQEEWQEIENKAAGLRTLLENEV